MDDSDLQDGAIAGSSITPPATCDANPCLNAGLSGTQCRQRTPETLGVHCHGFVVLPSDTTLSETSSQSHNLTLSLAPQETVLVTIISSISCPLPPFASIVFTESNYSKGIIIQVAVPGNVIDEGTNAMFAECVIMHTVTSTDAMYAHTPPTSFTISVLNDDNADVKLQIPQDDGSFEYRLKVMGPMTIDEGTNIKYALVLDTQPSANVSVSATIFPPRPTTPLTARLEPPSLVFTTLNWNVPQMVTFNASNDDIDNDHDVETFRIVYHASTEDSIFQSKATNNTVIVEVADDDTAGIEMDDAVLQLAEEGEWISFNIHRLGSQPLGDVLLSMVAHAVLEVSPQTVLVKDTEWQGINVSVQVRALRGDYTLQNSFSIKIEPNSTDPKYNGFHVVVPVVVAPMDNKYGTPNLPADRTLSEHSKYQY